MAVLPGVVFRDSYSVRQGGARFHVLVFADANATRASVLLGDHLSYIHHVAWMFVRSGPGALRAVVLVCALPG